MDEGINRATERYEGKEEKGLTLIEASCAKGLLIYTSDR